MSEVTAEPPIPGQPAARIVGGPTATGNDWRRFWILAWTLATTEFKLRFFDSVLGYVWALLRPLLLFAIIYTVFVVILGVGGEEPRFGVALLLGIVIFQLFTDATAPSIRSIVSRENLVSKVEFPLAAVPVACVIEAMFTFLLNLIPVLVFLFAAGGRPSLRWLEMPFVVVLVVAFVTGLALLLSALFIRYRDVEPIWEVVVQALFYATPILYSLSVVVDKAGPDVARVMLINPLATAIQQARFAMIDTAYESPAQIFGSAAGYLLPVAVTVLTLSLGAWVFNRAAPRMAEEI